MAKFILFSCQDGSTRLSAPHAISLNQSHRQTERPPQTRFLPGHLTVIPFVVVSRQMQHAVQRENLDFFHCTMPVAPRVVRSNFRRDCDISSEPRTPVSSRKR